MTLTAGGNQMHSVLTSTNVQVTDFVVRGLYTVQNGRAKNPVYTISEKKVNSLYGSTDLSWKRTLYLTGTIRKDWFSTLSKENNGILYPSVSGSYVFTETLKGALPWLNFGKVRLGYAEVGSDADVNLMPTSYFIPLMPTLLTTLWGHLLLWGAAEVLYPTKFKAHANQGNGSRDRIENVQ